MGKFKRGDIIVRRVDHIPLGHTHEFARVLAFGRVAEPLQAKKEIKDCVRVDDGLILITYVLEPDTRADPMPYVMIIECDSENPWELYDPESTHSRWEYVRESKIK